MVSDFFLPLEPRISPLAKHVVVSETSATERLGKIQLLLWRWVKPKFVGALRFHAYILHHFTNLCKDSFKKASGIGRASHAALSIPGLKAEVSRALR